MCPGLSGNRDQRREGVVWAGGRSAQVHDNRSATAEVDFLVAVAP